MGKRGYVAKECHSTDEIALPVSQIEKFIDCLDAFKNHMTSDAPTTPPFTLESLSMMKLFPFKGSHGQNPTTSNLLPTFKKKQPHESFVEHRRLMLSPKDCEVEVTVFEMCHPTSVLFPLEQQMTNTAKSYISQPVFLVNSDLKTHHLP
ncbi:unnamed protein product [Mesocestoides corti]|uniref:Retrovirus-related Pol polyprotein from transposon TNT 1-94 n=1 Tax=Mesocestoides corti TaxID=53468 RepID=A0A0R3UAC3_MESCO|nr:unnamed protein product [Mesocestoides corti]